MGSRNDNKNNMNNRDVYDFINKNNRRHYQNDDYNDYDYDDYDDYENYDEDYNDYDDVGQKNGYDSKDFNKKGIDIYPVKPKKQKQRMPEPKPKKRGLLRKFFLIIFAVVFTYSAVLGGYIVYSYLDKNKDNDYFESNNIISNIFTPSIPEKTTVLLAGVDKDETRTDTIMVACFTASTKKVDIISIPRDTLVKVPKDRFAVMQNNISNLTSREMKINSVHSYSGEQGMEFLQKQLEELLGISIDYYAKINFEGFRYLIDSIGGVEYTVEDNLYYNDKAGLVINLKKGKQILDGEKAEQLVRFRSGYKQADLHRIEVQRSFLKAFITQALQKEKITSNPSAYLKTIIEYVDTNVSVSDLLGYVSAVTGFDGNNFEGYTLPGGPKYINGGSYYIHDEEETKKMIDKIYYDKPDQTETTSDDVVAYKNEVKTESSKGKDIIILNGGYTTGLAKKAKDLLVSNGFTVSSIDNESTKINTTKIYVENEGVGDDLVKYFSNAEVVVNPKKCNNSDILIVLGINERLANKYMEE